MYTSVAICGRRRRFSRGLRPALVIVITSINLLLGAATAQSTQSGQPPQQASTQTAPSAQPSQQASQQSSQPTSPTTPPTAPQLQVNSAPVMQPQKNSAASELPDKNAPEIATQDTDSVFQVRVDLVEVRVVVRDAQGHPVTGLKKEDFQLLDEGKPQVVTKFSVEQPDAKPAIHRDGAIAEGPESAAASATALAPQRYVAYLFDDVNLPFGALANARMAAARQLETLPPTDRAAIYTTSGQTYLDFTDDRDALRDKLNRLMPRPIVGSAGGDCPHMTYYLADMIENRQDTQALSTATEDEIDCAFEGNRSNSSGIRSAAESTVHSAARQWLQLGAQETRVTLDTLRRVVQRTALMPGQRTIVLVSPGFLNTDQHQEELRMEERALHSGVVINTLDARGLYTPGDDASKYVPRRHVEAISQNVDEEYARYAEREKSAQADVLRQMAGVTGGKFFHNSNDLEAGFQQLAGAPEYAYLLAFSPLNLKRDGRWHALKVTVQGQRYDMQARTGYYAPTQAENAEAQAIRQIEEAVFSQEEWHDIPVQLHTQYFKVSEQDAKLSVLVRLDARRLHFRKVDGRNRNDVTVVSALFDRNGKFISGSEKVLQMRLKDETLGSKLMAALTLKTSFDVKAGSYLVRLVVREDGGHMSAQNDAVDIQ